MSAPAGDSPDFFRLIAMLTVGPIDLLGEIPGAHSYEQLLPDSLQIDERGVKFRCVKLPHLIRLKNAAGRPKDLEVIAELKVILEESG